MKAKMMSGALCAAVLSAPAMAADVVWTGADDFGIAEIAFSGVVADRLEFIDDVGADAAYVTGSPWLAPPDNVVPWLTLIQLMVDGVWKDARYVGGGDGEKIAIAGLAPISFASGEVTQARFRTLLGGPGTGFFNFNQGQALTLRFTDSRAAEAPVPEPATWAMMIAGFGLIGGAMRRGAPIKAAA